MTADLRAEGGINNESGDIRSVVGSFQVPTPAYRQSITAGAQCIRSNNLLRHADTTTFYS